MDIIVAKDNPSEEFFINCDPRIRAVYNYWNGKRKGRRMPSRSDIDPVEIPTLLANIILVDVLEDLRRFFYRLVGTDIVDKRGFDPTGEQVGGAYFGPSAASALSHYEYIAASGNARFIDSPYVEPRGWYVYSERLMMPLSDDDKRVNMVFVYALWKEAP